MRATIIVFGAVFLMSCGLECLFTYNDTGIDSGYNHSYRIASVYFCIAIGLFVVSGLFKKKSSESEVSDFNAPSIDPNNENIPNININQEEMAKKSKVQEDELKVGLPGEDVLPASETNKTSEDTKKEERPVSISVQTPPNKDGSWQPGLTRPIMPSGTSKEMKNTPAHKKSENFENEVRNPVNPDNLKAPEKKEVIDEIPNGSVSDFVGGYSMHGVPKIYQPMYMDMMSFGLNGGAKPTEQIETMFLKYNHPHAVHRIKVGDRKGIAFSILSGQFSGFRIPMKGYIEVK